MRYGVCVPQAGPYLGPDVQRRLAAEIEALGFDSLWETDTSTFAGRWKRYENMRMFPKRDRSRTTSIPIVVGGNAEPSIRRAAELGDGWHPINLSPSDLRDGILRYHRACERFGRVPGSVVLRHMPGGRTAAADELTPAQLADYEDAGCDELLLSLPVRDPDALVDQLRAFITRR